MQDCFHNVFIIFFINICIRPEIGACAVGCCNKIKKKIIIIKDNYSRVPQEYSWPHLTQTFWKPIWHWTPPTMQQAQSCRLKSNLHVQPSLVSVQRSAYRLISVNASAVKKPK